MRLILSREDPRRGMWIIHSIPNLNISDEIQEELRKVHYHFMNTTIGDQVVNYEFGSLSSAVFEVESPWFEGESEKIILSLDAHGHENPPFFRDILQVFLIVLPYLWVY